MKVISISVFLAYAVFSLAQQTSDSAPIAVTNKPIILKGIYGNRSLYGPKTNQDNIAESAVMRCLRWFKMTQDSDGSWGEEAEPKTMATAIALQALLKHGESTSSKEFGVTVDRGLKFLLSDKEEGKLTRGRTACAIDHGIYAATLCDAYAMTRNPETLPGATNAINVILNAQRPSGLWGATYDKSGNDDIGASTWQMSALKSARFCGISNDSIRPALNKAAEAMRKFIQETENKRGLGPALFSLQIASYERDFAYRTGFTALDELVVNWENPGFENPVFNWYFITQAKFHQGGRGWSEWNKTLKPTLVKRQTILREAIDGHRKDTKEDVGYWISPGTDEQFGKVYSSALCCMMLEIYYAWLPNSSARLINVQDGAGSR